MHQIYTNIHTIYLSMYAFTAIDNVSLKYRSVSSNNQASKTNCYLIKSKIEQVGEGKSLSEPTP